MPYTSLASQTQCHPQFLHLKKIEVITAIQSSSKDPCKSKKDIKYNNTLENGKLHESDLLFAGSLVMSLQMQCFEKTHML